MKTQMHKHRCSAFNEIIDVLIVLTHQLSTWDDVTIHWCLYVWVAADTNVCRPYSRSWTASGQIPLRCPARELDSVMKFDFILLSFDISLPSIFLTQPPLQSSFTSSYAAILAAL